MRDASGEPVRSDGQPRNLRKSSLGARCGRGVLLLAVLVSVVLGTAPTEAQQTTTVPWVLGAPAVGNAAPSQDALWYFANANSANTGVCVNPTTSASLASCFPTLPQDPGSSAKTRAATDGIYMYFVTGEGQSQKCPILDLGNNCQYIFAGPFNGTTQVKSVAAFGDSLYIGDMNSNAIYQCPNDLTYTGTSNLPSECVTYNFPSGTGEAESMIVTNDRLFVGMSNGANSGLIYSCNLDLALGCGDPWDNFGKNNHAWSMAAGGGYLWVGLDNGVMWRCSTNQPNDCQNWNTAGTPIVSIVYDAGWLYAGVANTYSGNLSRDKTNGVIWKCPAATANSCQTLLTPGPYSGASEGGTVSTQTVTAGAGNVFANVVPVLASEPATYWGTSPFALTVGSSNGSLCDLPSVDIHPWCAPWPMGLFYVPVGGIVTTGTLRVSLPPGDGLAALCANAGELASLVIVSGPNETNLLRTIDLCDQQQDWYFPTLDPGEYSVRVSVGGSEVSGTATVAGSATTSLALSPLLAPSFTG